MKVSPFTYFWYRLRYPGHKVFLDEGFGIEARYKSGAWDQHLSKSKLLVAEFLAKVGNVKSILILGAGRLYDCDLEMLSSFTEKIILLDADPRAKNSWPKSVRGVTVQGLCQDVTGVFREWKCGDYILPKEPNFPSADIIISLNLKSQLSVLFREYLGSKNQSLEAKLQALHVNDVFKMAKKGVIFIYDDSYRYLKDGVTIETESLDLSPIDILEHWKEILFREWDWELEKGKIIHKVIGRGFVL